MFESDVSIMQLLQIAKGRLAGALMQGSRAVHVSGLRARGRAVAASTRS